MKKIIVTTTINPPTEAIKKFDKIEGWDLIVVGDEKTPDDYKLERGHYMTLEEQDTKYPKLSELLGRNSVDRRNIGFVEAYNIGADVIASIDDDNIPMDEWGQVVLVGQEVDVDGFYCNLPVFDPLTRFKGIEWHRGFPIELINQRQIVGPLGLQPPLFKSINEYEIDTVMVTPLVQANLWNGDPDVDALYRMLFGKAKEDVFYGGDIKYYTSDKIAPFNTQNTIFARAAFPDYISIPFIGRMDDIWGAYYLQALHPNSVIFGPPTVVSVRNEHDISNDFALECIGYMHSLSLVEDLMDDPKAIFKYIPDKAKYVWDEYKNCFN